MFLYLLFQVNFVDTEHIIYAGLYVFNFWIINICNRNLAYEYEFYLSLAKTFGAAYFFVHLKD